MGLETKPLNDDAEFENDAIDPGFSTDESKIVHSNDQLSVEKIDDIEIPSDKRGDDAMNYKNDRENGAFNPKNI